MPQIPNNRISATSSRANTVSKPDRATMSNAGSQLTPLVQRLYSVFLWDLAINDILEEPSLDPSGQRPKAEYFFEVAPKVHEISDPFTTKVIATQNGGKYVESHGSIFKEIRVQGTTGLRPRKASPTVIPLLPTDTFQTLLGGGLANQIRTLPPNEITGFDDIHFLRNIFRRYSDLKGTGRQIVMVWRNIKDDDYWVVEPRDFKLVQNSKSPLTYEYQINFQGLARFRGPSPEIPEDPLAAMRDYHRFISRIQEYQQALLDSFLVVSTNISRIKGAGYFATDILLGSITNVIRGLSSVFSTIDSTRKALRQNAKDAKNNFNQAIDDLKDSLEPLSGGRRRRSPIIRTLRRLSVLMDKILIESLFSDSVASTEEDRRTRTTGSYSTRSGGLTASIRGPRTGGSPTYTGATGSPSSVSEGRVIAGETIADLTKRLLGDARRWKDLVLLNDLKSPYVSDDPAAGEGVLKPGDVVLYPGVGSETDSRSVNSANEFNPEEVTLVEQTYGRDLRLRSVPRGNDIDETDLVVNQRGDLSTVVGVPNVEQAIRLKFSTESGELPAHPYYGARFPIGSKSTIASFNTFRLNTIATLQSDERISEVVKLDFVTSGDILAVAATLRLTSSRDYLSTNFALRRL